MPENDNMLQLQTENEFTNDDILQSGHDFYINFKKREGVVNMPSYHNHSSYELYYQFSGERYYFIKDRTYYIKKGDFVLIDTYELHKTTYAGTPTYERILISFKDEYLKEFNGYVKELDLLACLSRGIPVLNLNLSEQNFIETLLFKMLEETRKNLKESSFYLKISLMELLIFLNRFQPRQKSGCLEFPSALHKKISKVAQYISANYAEELSLSSVAGEFSVSPYYLSRTFKEVTGFTFVEYISSIRIKEAMKLLTDTESSITDIAAIVGFDSSTHFGRVFKEVTKLSPLKFRKKAREIGGL
jgi:AraC-like DNA-binding protein